MKYVWMATLLSVVSVYALSGAREGLGEVLDSEVNSIGDDPNDCSVGLNEANQAECDPLDGAQ
jgi:hypothetical protein